MNNKVLELVCTRISHDLIGNIGAVANAVELLEEGDMDFLPDIHSILKISSATLSSRLKFFRMAFGLNNANLDNIDHVQKTISDYVATVGGKNPPIVNFLVDSARYNRAIMLCVMTVADLLIKGGRINVVEKNNQLLINVDENARLSEDKVSQIIKILDNDMSGVSAQDAPLLYLLEVCKNSGIKIKGNFYPSLNFILE